MDEKKLDSVLEELITRWEIPGLGIGIVQGSEIVYTRSFGVQNIETRLPITPSSIFCVASISKVFVATAVMQLVEQGKVDLQAPVVHYLPYFEMDDERYQSITIRQILSHTSGIPDMPEEEYDDLVSHPEYDEGAAERYVRGLRSRRLIAAPGERFYYSNIAYNLLGDLIAKISGQPFETYMKEKILLPAGMLQSTFFFPEILPGRLALPHLRTPEIAVNPIYPYHRADAPASFLHTTVEDMCCWCITFLAGGVHNGRRLVSSDSIDLMWTPAVSRGNPPLYEDMGLGWNLGHFEGEKTISHGGMGFGWSDFMVLLPEKKCAAVILSNEESSARRRTVRAVLDAMLGNEPQASTVSWTIPIAQALQEGGIGAAYTRSDEIMSSGSDQYFWDPDELPGLVIQLVSAKKIDLAIGLLKLNLHAFPDHLASQLYLARLFLLKSDHAQAEYHLNQVLAIQPETSEAVELLRKVQGR